MVVLNGKNEEEYIKQKWYELVPMTKLQVAGGYPFSDTRDYYAIKFDIEYICKGETRYCEFKQIIHIDEQIDYVYIDHIVKSCYDYFKEIIKCHLS